MAWIILIFAGCFEVLWAYFLKQAEGFNRVTPSILFVITLTISMVLLGVSAKTLPLSIAYPVWTGIGALGSVLVGIFLFGEKMNTFSILSVAFIVLGIIGLKISQSSN